MKAALKLLSKNLERLNTGLVLAGHGVANSITDPKLEEVHISLSDFSDQVELLEALDFDFLSMDELSSLSKSGFRHKKHWAHLTFDDGYVNNLEILSPYLLSKGIPFSVFVSTYNILNQERLPTFLLRYAQKTGKRLEALHSAQGTQVTTPDKKVEQQLIHTSIEVFDERVDLIKSEFSKEDISEMEKFYNDKVLSVTQLKDLAENPLVHIGSHSHNHVTFINTQNEEQMKNQIENSFQYLNKSWGISETPTFCYPNGNYSKKALKVLENAGVSMAFCSDSGFVDSKTNPLLIPRFWLSDSKKLLKICWMATLGNTGLRLLGRKRPYT